MTFLSWKTVNESEKVKISLSFQSVININVKRKIVDEFTEEYTVLMEFSIVGNV